MKILKRIIIIILVLIAIPFIMAIFIKKDYSVEKQVTINKPEPEVFDYIKHLKNQNDYNAWCLADPNLKNEYTGTDATEGFIYGWSGNEHVGKGEIEITKINENERLDMNLHFIEPFEGEAKAYMTTTPVGDNATTVTWVMSGHSNYPMNFMNLFTESTVGNNLQTSLENMKSNLEK
ncbi:SRPBCC family protein [Flavobacterium beibuense]|uniref:Polyketide cyclase / dehydrase and lipid transport n=1 Tax=Flavobacterium beibuense TaxID=657326 RepID=A0A444W8A0_9FLAO|nr:SRPBCC family protein [Flavobacterium beibuense]RYJ41972.1 Polyketide cyclase / dehydrase and lipid transport [Flavobacterium beibuense]